QTISCHHKTIGHILAQYLTPEKTLPKKNISRPPLINTAGCKHLKKLVTNEKRQFTADALHIVFEKKQVKQTGSNGLSDARKRPIYMYGIKLKKNCNQTVLLRRLFEMRDAWCGLGLLRRNVNHLSCIPALLQVECMHSY
ncbi:11181_t:CDS:2, partial [Acaulospora morrowiae]